MLTNYVISVIRTFVPIVIGAAAAWLASSLHLVIDPSSQAGLVIAVVSILIAAYYSLARFLETKFPNNAVLKFLLGVPAAVHYGTAEDAARDKIAAN